MKRYQRITTIMCGRSEDTSTREVFVIGRCIRRVSTAMLFNGTTVRCPAALIVGIQSLITLPLER